jgi:hypothetical protein
MGWAIPRSAPSASTPSSSASLTVAAGEDAVTGRSIRRLDIYLPPGHIPIGNALNSRIVQFSPTQELRDVEAVLMKNIQAMHPGH